MVAPITAVDNFPNVFFCTLAQSLTLGGAETSIQLSTIQTLDGQTITAADFPVVGECVLTIDVLAASQIECVSFTGTGAVGTGFGITGCTRGLSFKNKTVIAGNKKFHSVGAPCVIAFGTQNLIDIETQMNGNFNTLLTLINSIVVAAGVPATTIVPGLEFESTQSDTDAGTETRIYAPTTLPYPISVNPKTLRAKLYNSYVVDTGTANVYAIAPNPAITAYADGQIFNFKAINTNTSTATLAVNGLSAIPLVIGTNTPLVYGMIVAGNEYLVEYLGGNFLIIGSSLLAPISSAQSISSDETIQSWFTLQVPSPIYKGSFTGSTTVDSIWSLSASAAPGPSGSFGIGNGSAFFAITVNGLANMAIGVTAANTGLQFGNTARIKMKWIMNAKNSPNATHGEFVGFETTQSSTDYELTDLTARIGFVFSNGNLYGVVANGSALTSVLIGAYTTSVNNEYVIDTTLTTASPSVTFYVNGVASTPITTNFPSTGAVRISMIADSSTGQIQFISDLILSQKIN